MDLHHNSWFLDTCLLFEFRHGSALFQRLSDAVRHMMRQRSHDVTNYIDDILGIDLPSRVDTSFDTLSSLLECLGFEISQNKLVKPATCVNCLGILVDTKDFTLTVPPQNSKKYYKCVKHSIAELTALNASFSPCWAAFCLSVNAFAAPGSS